MIWYSSETHIIGNRVRDGRYGLHFMYANGSVIEDNRLTDNSVGIFLMYSRDILLRRNFLAHNRGPSGYGLGLNDVVEGRGIRIPQAVIDLKSALAAAAKDGSGPVVVPPGGAPPVPAFGPPPGLPPAPTLDPPVPVPAAPAPSTTPPARE